MRIALVINATAGSMSASLTPAAIRDRLARAGIVVLFEPDEGLPLPERVRAAAAHPGIAAVAVGGGDGTIACAAAVMTGADLPLALLPLGTMNMLARDLGLPIDLDGAIAVIVGGAVRRIDVGDVNGHSFLINSVLGMPTRVARHREALRLGVRPRAALRWIASLLRHLRHYPRLSVSGTVDGVERPWRVRMLAVVVDDYVEAPGRILVRAPVDGGTLTLYVLPRLPVGRMVRLAIGFAVGDWRRLPGFERVALTQLTIDSRHRALRVMNDGEVQVIAAPLHYRVRRRALPILMPAPAGGEGRP